MLTAPVTLPRPLTSTDSSNSPPRIKIKQVLQGTSDIVGKEVTIKGWVRTIRSQKTFSFIEVNDGSTLSGLQIVAETDGVPSYNEAVAAITTGAAVGVVGIVKESPGKGQKYEVSRVVY